MELMVDTADVIIERYELGVWATNAYLVRCKKSGKSFLVDAPANIYTLAKRMVGDVPEWLLLTHTHLDHIEGLKALKTRIDIPVAVHREDASNLPIAPDRYLEDGDVLRIGELLVKVIHTPGHTPGSVCFQLGEYLISGDTIFPGGPGKTWSKQDFQTIIQSITGKIFILPDSTRILPGHGSPTVLKKEKEEYATFSSRP
ncbi:MAG: MBL fold metallo-hydrolase, partial [Dehalococcoidales bacterium]|nr:MBL fold metallo-hydrolase [Dehalococcoidales bacterium]